MELSSEGLAGFFATTLPHLRERQRGLVVGAMAETLGRGGQARVVEASAMSSSTVARAVAEVRAGIEPWVRQRAPGAGDKPAVDKQPGLLEALDELVHPETRGTLMSALRWTLKSTDDLGWGHGDGLLGLCGRSHRVHHRPHQLGDAQPRPPDRRDKAGDYVEAMWLILQQDQPDYYVMATGETHSVREFCELAFERVGLDWEKYAVVDERSFGPPRWTCWWETPPRPASSSAGEPRTSFEGLVNLIVDADVALLEGRLQGIA